MNLAGVFLFLAFLFDAARFLAAILLESFFLAGEVVVVPSPTSALAPLAALACIDVATVPKAALTAAAEASFAAMTAVTAVSATLPASTLVLSATLFPAAKTVSRAPVYGALTLHFRSSHLTVKGGEVPSRSERTTKWGCAISVLLRTRALRISPLHTTNHQKSIFIPSNGYVR